ncbi:Hpt domain-containing protein [uncultured Litoreibacter sp.]|uniref:Hpt domain-containing protein n=1 Tax=uncultured Litoreibacter sp. TaxID=1392394 RepID=UPI002635BAF2|nr:Hpt domain-containing protein [uncultured Litoreibacter sp.]
MVDWVRTEELRQDFGEEDFLEIAGMFIAEVEERLASLAGKSPASLSEDFHFLKGSAANLGFHSFQVACSQAETAPQHADLAHINELFATSKDAFLDRYQRDKQVA